MQTFRVVLTVGDNMSMSIEGPDWKALIKRASSMNDATGETAFLMLDEDSAPLTLAKFSAPGGLLRLMATSLEQLDMFTAQEDST